MKSKAHGAGSNFNEFFVRFLLEWMKIGLATWTNFRIEAVREVNCREVVRQWEGMTTEEVEWDILEAEERVKLKRRATGRDVLLTRMGRSLLRHRLDTMSRHVSYLVFVDNPMLIPKDTFINMGNVSCWTFDASTGQEIRFPLQEWASRYFNKYTVVIHGDADPGKTEVAKCLLAELAVALQTHEAHPYFIKCETIDGMREAVVAGHSKRGVPVLFDELRPDAGRGGHAGQSGGYEAHLRGHKRHHGAL